MILKSLCRRSVIVLRDTTAVACGDCRVAQLIKKKKKKKNYNKNKNPHIESSLTPEHCFRSG